MSIFSERKDVDSVVSDTFRYRLFLLRR